MKRCIAMTLTAVILSGLCFQTRVAAFKTYLSAQNTPYAWDMKSVPGKQINFSIDPAAPAELHDVVVAAAKQWSDSTGGTLQFTEGPNGIQIVWDAAGTTIPNSSYLAYTTFTANSSNTIVGARLVINAADYTWHTGGDGGVGPTDSTGKRSASFDSVILHELGHALGLDHSDANPAGLVGAPGDIPTMNSIIFAGAQDLHTDDQAGIRSIYGQGNQQTQQDQQQTQQTTQSQEKELLVSASPSSAKVGTRVFFTQPGGDATTSWDFGDGSTGIGADVTHRYMASGTYVVTAQSSQSSGKVTVEITGKSKIKRVIIGKKNHK